MLFLSFGVQGNMKVCVVMVCVAILCDARMRRVEEGMSPEGMLLDMLEDGSGEHDINGVAGRDLVLGSMVAGNSGSLEAVLQKGTKLDRISKLMKRYGVVKRRKPKALPKLILLNDAKVARVLAADAKVPTSATDPTESSTVTGTGSVTASWSQSERASWSEGITERLVTERASWSEAERKTVFTDYSTVAKASSQTSSETSSKATQPETTQSEATQPEATQPEATQPETTQPEATQPETTQPDATQPEAIQPETTQPEATQPEATQPEATEYASIYTQDQTDDWNEVRTGVMSEGGTGYVTAGDWNKGTGEVTEGWNKGTGGRSSFFDLVITRTFTGKATSTDPFTLEQEKFITGTLTTAAKATTRPVAIKQDSISSDPPNTATHEEVSNTGGETTLDPRGTEDTSITSVESTLGPSTGAGGPDMWGLEEVITILEPLYSSTSSSTKALYSTIVTEPGSPVTETLTLDSTSPTEGASEVVTFTAKVD